VLLAGCGGGAPKAAEPIDSAPRAGAQQQSPAPPAKLPDARPVIVAFGDSLSAGFGADPGQSYPDFLQRELDQRGYHYRVVNAGNSGDTTTDGLVRIDTVTALKPAIVILEFGGNDGLRGLPVSEMKKNLAAIIEHAQSKSIAVLLAGMEAPPNFGPEYTVSFRQVYRDLAKEHKVTLLPFLLDKVAGVATLNQSDGIHPNVEGARIVADTVWNVLKPMVDAASAS